MQTLEKQSIYVKAKELSEITGIPKSTIHDLKEAKILPHYRFPGKRDVYYKRVEVLAILEGCKQ